MVEGISNILHPTDYDTEYTSFKMANATIQATKILPQLVQKIQQMQTLMAQIQNQLKRTNKNGGNYNSTGGGKRVTRYHFGDNSTARHMVHAITKRAVVAQK